MPGSLFSPGSPPIPGILSLSARLQARPAGGYAARREEEHAP